MTCPNCGARNTADAPWCTQCLQPLGRDPAPGPGGAPPSDPVAPSPDPASPSPAPPPRAPADGAATDRDVRSVDGVVEWRCPTCRSWNALERSACAVCGQALAASVTGTGRDRIVGQVSRARRMLWIAAGVGGVLMVVAVVLLVLALRSGTAG